MKSPLIASLLAVSTVAFAAAPVVAEAKPHKVWVCKTSKSAKTTGTVLGAVGGGLLGNAVTDGKTGGTIIGAGAGALAGREIAKGGKKKCRYEWRD